MDPIKLLVDEHRRMEKLLAEIMQGDATARRRLFPAAADALTAHVTVEEQHFYPAVRARRTEDILLESLEEHLSLKRVLADLLELDIEDPHWEPKLHVLKEQVEHHHKEEEQGLFPCVTKLFSHEELDALGDEMEKELAASGAARPAERVKEQTSVAAPLDVEGVQPLAPTGAR
jgi:hemerythrin superfamily protein